MFFYSKDSEGHNTGTQMLWIPYAGVAAVVLIQLATVFKLSNVPDSHEQSKETPPEFRNPADGALWTRPPFAITVIAQFLYMAAQAGIFSFLINYLTAETPPIPASWLARVSYMAAHLPWATDLL